MPPGLLTSSSGMEIIRWLQSHLGAGVEPFFFGVTWLGSSVVLWILLMLYCWLVDPGFGRRLAIVFAASILTWQTLKEVFDTARPFELDALVSGGRARRTGGGPGFPSGHSVNAATFWIALAFRHDKLVLWLTSSAVVVLVGLSRLYLGMHMPVDVLGGLLLGLVFAWLAGGWSGPRLRMGSRRLWSAVAVLGGLLLALLGVNPGFCGVLAGALLAQPASSPPRNAGGKLLLAGGGLTVLTLLAFLFVWLPDRLSPGLADSVPVAYLAGFALALVGLDLWPRAFSRWSGRSAASIA